MLGRSIFASREMVRVEWHRKTSLRRRMTALDTMDKNAVQYITVQYITVQYITVQYITVQYITVQYNMIQYSTIIEIRCSKTV